MAIGKAGICAVVRSEILDGKYDGGVRFPSEPALARRFGVSRSTVTRVLDRLKQDGLLVSRKGSGSRVRFEKLGGSRCIGLLVPGLESNDFYEEIIKGAHEKCRELGYELLVERVIAADGKLRQRRDATAVAREFIRRHVDGVVLLPFSPLRSGLDVNSIFLATLEKEGMVVLLLNRPVECAGGEACDLVWIDNVSAGRRIARHLIERGVRRCVFLDVPPVESVHLRYIGVASEFAEVRGGECRKVSGSIGSERTVMGWMRRFKPQAFACGNDRNAYKLMETLGRLGVNVPDDVMVTGFDDLTSGKVNGCGLTTISQPLAPLGATAIRRLVDHVRDHSLPHCAITLDAPLVIRESTTRSSKPIEQRHPRAKNTKEKKQCTKAQSTP